MAIILTKIKCYKTSNFYPSSISYLTFKVCLKNAIYIYTHNLVKSLFSMKIVQNSRTFCHVYNNDDTSKSWEFKADTRYFYSNRIMQVFNKICAFESTALLKPLKPWSWLLAPNQLKTPNFDYKYLIFVNMKIALPPYSKMHSSQHF